MNEYIVLFADKAQAKRAGIQVAYTVEVMQILVIRLSIPFLPWNVMREAISYAHLQGNHYLHQTVSDDFSSDFLHGVIKHAVRMNLTPIKISQW
jgi:hypothetical protein